MSPNPSDKETLSPEQRDYAEGSTTERGKPNVTRDTYVSVPSHDNDHHDCDNSENRHKSLEQPAERIVQPLASMWWIYLLSVANFGVGGSWAL